MAQVRFLCQFGILISLTMICSGYDFGYFVKLLTAESLPTAEDQFFDLLQIWFPTVYDVKFLMRSTKILRGGLQELADDLGVCLYALQRL